MTESVDDPIAVRMGNVETTIEKLRGTDFSRVEVLGNAHGLVESEAAKTRVLAYIDDLIRHTKEFRAQIPDRIIESALRDIQHILSQFQNAFDESEAFANSEGVHKPEFPGNRKRIEENCLKQEKEMFAKLRPFERDLMIQDIFKRLSNTDAHSLVERAESAFRRIGEIESEMKRTLEKLQTQVLGIGVSSGQQNFFNRSRDHKLFESRWFAASVAFSVVFVFAFLWAAVSPGTGTTTAETLSLIFQRTIVLSIPLIFLRLALTKFNSERNLRIVYEHRQTVLDLFEYFETGIGEDAQSRSNFRLQVAKLVLSDPTSGYLGKDNSTDVNINPMVTLIEKAMKP